MIDPDSFSPSAILAELEAEAASHTETAGGGFVPLPSVLPIKDKRAMHGDAHGDEERKTMTDTAVSERPTYTLHAVKSEEAAHFGRVGVYASHLTGPGGYLEQRTSDPERPVQLAEDLDTLYAAAIAALRVIPEGSHLHVVSRSQHHHGKTEGPGQYRGTFNTAPEEREASGYTDKKGKGFISNLEQVKAMDGVLKARRLTTSGEHWRKGQDQGLYTTLFQRAHATMQKASLIANGVEPPEDY